MSEIVRCCINCKNFQEDTLVGLEDCKFEDEDEEIITKNFEEHGVNCPHFSENEKVLQKIRFEKYYSGMLGILLDDFDKNMDEIEKELTKK